jgi:hypothetical protein
MPVWPCSRYSSPPNSKPRKTGPSAGQLHALAEPGANSTIAATTTSVVFFVNIGEAASVAVQWAVVKTGYKEPR